MSTLQQVSPSLPPAGTGFARSILAFGATMLKSLLHPRSVIADVEAWRALNVEAERLETRDPARAAQLRRRAERIGRD